MEKHILFAGHLLIESVASYPEYGGKEQRIKMKSNKIVSKTEFKNNIKHQLKKAGKKTVLCHGVFDLVHPGHIQHFEQAKGYGDVLIVSITSEKYVRKGPGRPFFNDNLRMKFLCEMECVDYVMLSECYTVDDIIEAVEPDFYVKGAEYADEDADVTGMIRRERELVEAHGGKLVFTYGEVFSSTKLINKGLSGLTEEIREYMEAFRNKHPMEEVLQVADRISGLKILVIGEIIIDRYTWCSIHGLMSKDMGYSARLERSEDSYGGAAAVARHLSSFAKNVTLMSVVGSDGYAEKMKTAVSEGLTLKLFESDVYPTIIKHRYLSRDGKREEYQKIFSVDNMNENGNVDKAARNRLFQTLKDEIRDYDAVFVCDFGHGLLDDELMELLQEKSSYLALNCQTNSSNYGLNPITKYRRADVFTVDERELGLAYPSQAANEAEGLKSLSKHFQSQGFLTRGSYGAYGTVPRGDVMSCPAFTLTVKDTVGAGDAFHAVAGIYACAGADNELSLFMGNIAGALAANIIGNSEAVEKVNVLKYASTLMNV